MLPYGYYRFDKPKTNFIFIKGCLFMKKRVLSFLFALVICLSVPVVAFAESESVDDGNGTWYGGFETVKGTEYVFSKICDEVEDGYKYNATVWAKNDKGHQKTKTGSTDGLGDEYALKTRIASTYDSWFAVNECGYKNVTRTRTY